MGLINKIFGEATDAGKTELSPAETQLAVLALAAGGVAAGTELPRYINRVAM